MSDFVIPNYFGHLLLVILYSEVSVLLVH